MKRTILTVILCLLLCSAAYGENKIVGATIQGAVVGSSGAAACGTLAVEQSTNDSSAFCGYDAATDRFGVASNFTASASGIVRTLYLQMKRVSTAAQNLTVYLCTDSGSTTPVSNASCVAADATIDASTLSTSYAEIKISFTDHDFSLTASTMYWIKVVASAVHETAYVSVGYNGSVTTGPRYIYSPDDTYWTVADNTAQFTFRITSCVE